MNEEELEAEMDAKIKEWHDKYKVDWRILSLILREQADFCFMRDNSEKYFIGYHE